MKRGTNYVILLFIITSLVSSGIIYGMMSVDNPNNFLRNQKTSITIATPFQFPEETIFFNEYYGRYSWKDAISAGLYRTINSIENNYEPDLALNYPLIDLDLRTITIDLKPDLKFSNGEPLTSLDVAYSYQLALNSERGFGYGSYSSYLSYTNILIVDNSTIKFRLDQPYPFYMDLFTLPIVSRNALFDKYDAYNVLPNNYTDFILAGPFSYNSNDVETMSLVKNPNYWDADNIAIEEITFRYFSSINQVVLEIQNNSIDIISPLFMITEDIIQNKTDLVFSNIPDTSHNELSLNHNSPYWGKGELLPGNIDENEEHKLADALKIRRAFSHTVDRSFVIDDELSGHGVQAVTEISPSTFGYQSTIEPDSYSIDLAKSLFMEVGYDYSDLGEPDNEGNYNNFFFNLTLMSLNTESNTSEWMPQFGQDLPKIGVGVNQHYLASQEEIISRIFFVQDFPLFDEGGIDTIFMTYNWERNYNPSFLYSPGLFTAPNVYMSFDNSSLDNIMEDYLSEFDYQVRVNKLEILKKSLYDNMIGIPIAHNSLIWIWREEISGIDPLLINFGNVDWSEVHNTEYVPFGDSISDYLWFLIAPLIGAIITWILFKKKYQVYQKLDSVVTYPEPPINNE